MVGKQTSDTQHPSTAMASGSSASRRTTANHLHYYPISWSYLMNPRFDGKGGRKKKQRAQCRKQKAKGKSPSKGKRRTPPDPRRGDCGRAVHEDHTES